MKLYELYIVLKPTLNEDGLNKFTTELTDSLTKDGFGITSSKTKLNEYLPYLIKHFIQAHTIDLELSGEEESIFPKEVESQLRHGENVLRYMLLSKTEKMLKKTKSLPVFEPRQYRSERTEKRPALVFETIPVIEQKPEVVEMNVEEVDKKLEELLK
ncbi:MAG: 30S ribosomal protein S6 [Patescibacteria group bacterium]